MQAGITRFWGEMSLKVLNIIALVALVLTMSSAAFACPLCHTTTAEEVRASLAATMTHKSVLMAMTLPFIAIGIVVSILNHRFFDPPTGVEESHEP